MPSFHLSSKYSKAAVKSYIERKLCHAQSTLDEYLHLKFVVGKRYLCELPDADPTQASADLAPSRMQQCVLVSRLEQEYEVQLADEFRRLVRVKTLHALPVQPQDDCDWSDEAYARDSISVLAAIAADFPHFQLLQRRPEPQRRISWPIKFYHPPGTSNVRSKMDFDEVDYGTSFAPFVSEAMMPSLTGAQREWLMKTVCRFCNT
jgi:hypothetical protein